MFSLNDALEYYLYAHYIEMGKGIEKLSELLRTAGANPLNGNAYLFVSKEKNMMKILRWERDGFILYQKRLEQGTFELPRFKPGKDLCRIDYRVFFLIMEGISWENIKLRKRLFI